MNPQDTGTNPAPNPNPSPLFTQPPVGRSTSMATGNYLMVITVVLALGTVVFGILAAVYANQASNTRKTADTQRAKAVENAKAQQKADDETTYQKIAGSPFRSYTAPVAYGSFQVYFPKNWSSYAEEQASGTQVFLRLNPDFVRKTNNQPDKDAAHVSLIDQSADNYMRTFESQVKQGVIKKGVITVSNLPGYDLTGKFSDKRTVREVVIPVRDKIIVFTTENDKYASDFNEILAQAKIIP